MKVDDILEAKGRRVETISPGATVEMAVHRLSSLGIGALVVSGDGEHLDGVVSERDVVRGLSRHGPRLLERPVSEVMTSGGPVCAPDDTLKRVMAEMTRTRNRHVPVLDGDRLCGLVSIGDVVKNRLEELELETNVLRDAYLAGR